MKNNAASFSSIWKILNLLKLEKKNLVKSLDRYTYSLHTEMQTFLIGRTFYAQVFFFL